MDQDVFKRYPEAMTTIAMGDVVFNGI